MGAPQHTTSIRSVVYWYRRLIDPVTGTNIWTAIEGSLGHLLELLGFDLTEAILLDPPTLSLQGGDVCRLGPFWGWGGAGVAAPGLYPLFSLGDLDIDYSTATHGDATGPTEVLTAGRSRSVVILARYKVMPVSEHNDGAGSPTQDQLHHGVELRVMMSAEQLTEVWAAPSDYTDALDEGCIPVAAILRTTGGDTLVPILSHARHARPRPDGIGIGELMRRDSPAFGYIDPVVVEDNGSGGYKARLDQDTPWALRLEDGVVFDTDGNPGDAGAFVIDPIPAGEWLLRLQWVDTFPVRPVMYLAAATSYPSASGDTWLDSPEDLKGDPEDAVSDQAFLSTRRDVILAYINYDGAVAPTVYNCIQPAPDLQVEVFANPLYTAIDTPNSALTRIVINLPPAGMGSRGWDIEVDFDEVDEDHGDVPANRGGAHNLRWNLTYQAIHAIELNLVGEWFDTSGAGLTIPASGRYFRPGARVRLKMAPIELYP